MSDNPKPSRPSIDPNLLALLVAVVTIIGANIAVTSMVFNSLRNEMDARFDSVNQRLDGMDTRFDSVDQRLDGMDTRFDSIDQRLDRVDNRLQRIDTKLYDLNGRLARVESGVFGYEPPAPLELPPEDQSSPLSETTPAPEPVAGL